MIVFLCRERCDYLTFSPNGHRLATVEEHLNDVVVVRTWNGSAREVEFTCQSGEGCSSNVDFSPCGHELVFGTHEQVSHVLDAATGRVIQTLRYPPSHDPFAFGLVLGVAWSSDGQRVATAGSSGRVDLWNAYAGQLILSLLGHSECVA